MSETIFKHARNTALTLMAFALIFTFAMVIVYETTKAPIAKSEAIAKMALFAQIIDANHENDVLKDTLTLAPNPLLGSKQSVLINRVRQHGAVQTVVFEAIAPDGYSGNIKLLIAINADKTVSGVRVITHKETPGLGDYIEIAKDQWIQIFAKKSLSAPAENRWLVKKDGGEFDYMAGATITPRAVVAAVRKALLFTDQNYDALFGISKPLSKG